jgi:neutral ceramidase
LEPELGTERRTPVPCSRTHPLGDSLRAGSIAHKERGAHASYAILTTMLGLAISAFLFGQTSLSIGSSKVDITPNVPLPLGGYTERGTKLSVPGGDHLFARTVFFQSGKTKIAVVSVETLTIPESLAREVKKRIPSDVFLFLAATHTHSAPDSQMLNDHMTFGIPGIASYQPKWLSWYANKIAAGVRESSVDLIPSQALLTKEAHADYNIGRRKFADPDKEETEILSRFMMERPPTPSSSGGLTISSVTEVPVDVPLILQYAAHGTVYGAKELHTRGDWPGAIADKWSVSVLQGPIGDVLPKDWGPTPEKSIEKIVNGLGTALAKGMTSSVWKSGEPLRAVSMPVKLDPVLPHPTMAKSYGVPQAFADSIVKQFAPTSATIVAFRIGKLAVVGVPGEPTSILGRQIKDAGRRMGFSSVLVCSHVNGWMGYILDPDDYDRGGYEATLSFYGRDEGAKVVEAGIVALKELSGP